MKANSTADYKKELEALRSRIRRDAEAIVRQTLSPAGGQDAGDLSNAPFHLADEGTEEFMHDMNAALAENETYLLGEVEEALHRLEAGTYGVCEMCSEKIAEERLEAMPYVRQCVRCAAENQTGLNVNYNSGRPRSPADTLAPEGAMEESWEPADDDGLQSSGRRNQVANDEHAVGEPGGGSAIGGLSGSNSGHGDPETSDLQDAMGSGAFDVEDAREAPPDTPRSGRSGGAVGGTPARKRSS